MTDVEYEIEAGRESPERSLLKIFIMCPSDVSFECPLVELCGGLQEFFTEYGCEVESFIDLATGETRGEAGQTQLQVLQKILDDSDLVFLICTPSLFKELIDGQHTGVIAKLFMHSSFLSNPVKAAEKFLCVFLESPGCPVPSASLVPPVLGAYKRYIVKVHDRQFPGVEKVKDDLYAGGNSMRKKMNLLKSPFLQLVNRVKLKQEECAKVQKDAVVKQAQSVGAAKGGVSGHYHTAAPINNGCSTGGPSRVSVQTAAGSSFSCGPPDKPEIISWSISKADSVESDSIQRPTSSSEVSYNQSSSQAAQPSSQNSQVPQSASQSSQPLSPPPPAPPQPRSSHLPEDPPQLDQAVDEGLIWAVSSEVNHMKRVARTLRLREADITAIQMNDPSDYREQKYQVLFLWMSRNGAEATARCLRHALTQEGDLEAARSVDQYLATAGK